MQHELKFRKSGKEIKEAIKKRITQLQQRLEKRNELLDDFMSDSKQLRSYLIRSTQQKWMHGGGEAVLYGKDDISSEAKEEISQLCRRIFEIEQELHRLAIASTHLSDDSVFDLTFNELIAYGFDKNMEVE